MAISIAYLYTQNNNIIKIKQTKNMRNTTQIPVNCINIASFKELMLLSESP